jgi:outer membrane protein
MNEEIAKLEENLSKQRLFVDDPQKIQAWEREIAQKRGELRQFVTTGDDALRDKQDELAKPILDEIRAAIQEWGKTHGYSLVLEKQLIALYHEPEMDITDAILADLNARAANEATTSNADGNKGASGTANAANGTKTPQTPK